MLGSTALNLGSLGSQLLNSPSNNNPNKPFLLPPIKPLLKSPNPSSSSSSFLKSRTSVRTAVAAVESSDAAQKVEFFEFPISNFFPRLMLFHVGFEFECVFARGLILNFGLLRESRRKGEEVGGRVTTLLWRMPSLCWMRKSISRS